MSPFFSFSNSIPPQRAPHNTLHQADAFRVVASILVIDDELPESILLVVFEKPNQYGNPIVLFCAVVPSGWLTFCVAAFQASGLRSLWA